MHARGQYLTPWTLCHVFSVGMRREHFVFMVVGGGYIAKLGEFLGETKVNSGMGCRRLLFVDIRRAVRRKCHKLVPWHSGFSVTYLTHQSAWFAGGAPPAALSSLVTCTLA